jgi:hypothetical protein
MKPDVNALRIRSIASPCRKPVTHPRQRNLFIAFGNVATAMYRLRVNEGMQTAFRNWYPMVDLRCVRVIRTVRSWRIERFMAKRTPSVLT